MALLHDATLTPGKVELIEAWLPSQSWAATLPKLDRIGGYRIDDPAGEVGIEGILLRSEDGAVTVHVPLTYRGAPLEGAEDALVGTMEHSVLGPRWVYDAAADPVSVAAITDTITAGGTQAEEFFEVDGQKVTRDPSVHVEGSGGEPGDLVVVHVIGAAVPAGATLTGRWDGGEGVLAYLST